MVNEVRHAGSPSAVVEIMSDLAFVISPIGDDLSGERKLADWVFEKVITRACERVREKRGVDLHPERGDQDPRPGVVMEHVLSRILEARIIIAVLAFGNPNVYYELALAHSAGRKVLLLHWEKEPKRVFDIAHLRQIDFEFDLSKHKNPVDYDLVEKIYKQICELLDEKEREALAFRKYIPLDGKGDFKVFQRFGELKYEDDGSDNPFFVDEMLACRKNLTVFGTTLRQFLDPIPMSGSNGVKATFPNFLSTLVLDGVDVRLIMMHHANPSIETVREVDENGNEVTSIDEIRRQAKESFEIWSRLATDLNEKAANAGKTSRLYVKQLHHAHLGYKLMYNEKRLLLTPYFRQTHVRMHAPCMIVEATNGFYKKILADSEAVLRLEDLSAGARSNVGRAG